jgi:hypothetical protein
MLDGQHSSAPFRSGGPGDEVLVVLRTAAALLTVVPELRVRFRDGERFLAEVGRGPVDATAGPQIRSSVFRADVVRLHQGRRPGAEPPISATPGPCPAVDFAVTGGRVLPGGILRVRRDGSWHQVAAVTLPRDRCLAEVDDLDLSGLDVSADDDLDVTLLHADTVAADRQQTWRVLDALEAVVARTAVVGLEDHLRARGGRVRR